MSRKRVSVFDEKGIGNLALLRKWFLYVKTTSQACNQVESIKRNLALNLKEIDNFILPFQWLDLDQSGRISPANIQSFLIQHRHFHQPVSISRYLYKYSHFQHFLNYDHLLEALLPHSDYILVKDTIQIITEKHGKHRFSPSNDAIGLVAGIISLEITAMDADYRAMQAITHESLQVGALLWRLLDQDHCNELSTQKVIGQGESLGVEISCQEWKSFVYWHFHSFKTTLRREDFMLILNVHATQKRVSSACKIDHFKVSQQLLSTQPTIHTQPKISILTHLNKCQFTTIQHQQFTTLQPFKQNTVIHKKQLKGKRGYHNAVNVIKSVNLFE